MRFTIFVSVILSLLLFVSCAEKKEAVVEDVVKAYPQNTKVVFENDLVKAVEFTLKPGDKIAKHTGGPRVIYALSDYTIKWTEGDQTTEKQWTTGDAHWHGPMVHAVENIGQNEARYLVVTRKSAALPTTEGYDIAQDASQVDSEHSNAVFENDQVRVIEVMIPPGEDQPQHDGVNRLIYSLTNYTINYSVDENEPKEMTMAAGEAHWHGADRHSVENIGDTPAQYVIFEFLK